MELEIINFEPEDDDAPVHRGPPVRKSLPTRPDRATGAPPPPQAPPPPTAVGEWFACNTETCSHYAHIATGGDQVVHRERTRRCQDCAGLGTHGEGTGSCYECGGRGKIVVKAWDDPVPMTCPYCRGEMVPVDSPVGYPRMGIPDPEELAFDSGGKHVSFGRVRKMTDG